MAWYDTGTISLTNGNTTVTGAGTDFISGAQIGEALYAPDGNLYEIQSITSATVLVLADDYLGATVSGQDYKIIPTQSLVADLAGQVTDLITDYSDVKDGAGAGKFNDGTVTSPAITFTQDQNNGLYRIGSDNYGLSAGGTKQIDISTTDVELNYSGSKKLATTATGVDVTGTVQADGLTVDKNYAFQGANYHFKLGENSGDSYLGSFGNGHFSATGYYYGSNQYQLTGGSTNLTGYTATSDFTIFAEDGLTANSLATSKARLRIDGATGDVSFYEDTGTTAKFVWDASAESLTLDGQIGITNFDALKLGTAHGGGASIAYSNDGNLKINPRSSYSTVFETGRVGIGTASPQKDVHIVSTGGGSIRLERNDSALQLNDSIGSIDFRQQDPSSDGEGVVSKIESINESSFRGAAGLSFSTGDASTLTERMRINSAGNVGIGVSPESTSNLHIYDNSSDVKLTLETTDPYDSFINFSGATNEISVGYDRTDNSFRFCAANSIQANERMRLDSSGNLLVGKTSSSPNVEGVQAYSNGILAVSKDSGRPLYINRNTTDGALVDFVKNGTTVGSIGTYGSTPFIQAGSAAGYCGLLFNSSGGTGHIQPTMATGASSADPRTDNAVSLGNGTHRFKDLYLSGGVYLGGTGAANKLDDYETGSWTPSIRVATTDYQPDSGHVARYTKIGNVVHCDIYSSYSSLPDTTGDLIYFNLPFTSTKYQSVVVGIGERYADANLFHGSAARDISGGVIETNSKLLLSDADVGFVRSSAIKTSGNLLLSLTYKI